MFSSFKKGMIDSNKGRRGLDLSSVLKQLWPYVDLTTFSFKFVM